MPSEQDSRFTVKLEVKPDRVVSNGTDEVVLKCSITDEKKKSPKEDIPVAFLVRKQRVREEKTAHRGAATFKFKPSRPTGRTRISCETPHGSDSAWILINPTPAQYVRDMLWAVLMAFIVAFGVIRPFILQTFYIPSGSMEPTLYEHDRLVGLMFPYRFRDPRPGEIVIFTRPDQVEEKRIPLTPVKWKSRIKFIKRVVAVGGDTVEVKDLTVYLNGRPVDEPFIKQPPFQDMAPYKVPEGCVFLMGDNRNNSLDARFWGPVVQGRRTPEALDRRHIISKAVLRFWPPDRAGLVRSVPRRYK